MKLLVALGGNALLKRGQAPSVANQSVNVCVAADQLARVAVGNDLVVTHGNGPQIGLLALQSATGDPANAPSLDTLGVDCFVIATDVTAVSFDWGTPRQRQIGRISPQALARHTFATGSMGPKVQAACAFVRATGQRAVIGSLEHIEAMLAGQSGTQVCVGGSND